MQYNEGRTVDKGLGLGLGSGRSVVCRCSRDFTLNPKHGVASAPLGSGLHARAC